MILNYFNYIEEKDIERIKVIDELSLQSQEYFPIHAYSFIHTSDRVNDLINIQTKKVDEFLNNKNFKSLMDASFNSITSIYEDSSIGESYKIFMIAKNVANKTISLNECKSYLEKILHDINETKEKRIPTDIRKLLCVYDFIKCGSKQA